MSEPPSPIDELIAHEQWVRRLAHRLVRDAKQAEDVAQESWLRALRSPPTSMRNVRAWLSRVVRRTARDQHRGEERRLRREQRVEPSPPSESTQAVVERVQLQRAVVRHVMALPPQFRDVVLLRYFESRSLAEIAERLDLPLGTAESRLHRAVSRLREAMGRRYGQSAWITVLGAWAAGEHGVSTTAWASRMSTGSISSPPRTTSTTAASALIGGIFMATTSMKVGLAVAAVGITSILLWPGAGEHDAAERTGTEKSAVADLDADPLRQDDAGPGTERGGPAASRVESPAPPTPPPDLVPTPKALHLELSCAGKPAEGRVIVYDEETTLGPETLQRGRVHFESPVERHGEAYALVLRDGALPERQPLPALAGEHRIELVPGSSVLSFEVLVDGAVPTEPIPLLLESKRALDWIEGLPFEVRQRAAWPFVRPTGHLPVWADAGGQGRMDALPEGWRGALRVSNRHGLLAVHGAERDGERALLPSLDAHLRLELRTLPSIRGRVVDSRTGEGLDEVRGDCWIRFRDGHTSPLTGFATESDGRFLVMANSSDPDVDWTDPAQWVDYQEVRIRLWRGGVSLVDHFQGEQLDSSGDLGTLAMESGRPLDFVVQDEHGAPIEGAVVLAEGAEGRSNSEGHGRLEEISPETESLQVGALGYRTLDLPLPELGGEPACFSLSRSNLLRLRVTSQHPLPESVTLSVLSRPGLFPSDPQGGISSVHRRLPEASFDGSNWSGDSFELRMSLPSSGEIALHELAPGRAFRVQLRDRLGGLLLEKQVPGLQEQEERTVTLGLNRVPVNLVGHVVNAGGEPAAGASVRLHVGRSGCSATTGDDGSFHFDPILAATDATATLQATRESDAPSLPVEVPLDRTHELLLRLTRAHEVEIRVGDDQGHPVEVEFLTVELEEYDFHVRPEPQGQGSYLATGLPPGSLHLSAFIGRRPYHAVGRSEDGHLALEVPRHGRLRVHYPRGPYVERYDLKAVAESLEDGHRHSWTLGQDGQNGQDGEGGRVGSSVLLPGRYRVTLEWTFVEDPPAHATREVEVRADTESAIRFGEE